MMKQTSPSAAALTTIRKLSAMVQMLKAQRAQAPIVIIPQELYDQAAAAGIDMANYAVAPMLSALPWDD